MFMLITTPFSLVTILACVISSLLVFQYSLSALKDNLWKSHCTSSIEGFYVVASKAFALQLKSSSVLTRKVPLYTSKI
jgi:hypothetical protein